MYVVIVLILNALGYLAGFINDMLDLARLESGHAGLALAAVSIGVLVAEVVRSQGLQARAADVHVQVETRAVLPVPGLRSSTAVIQPGSYTREPVKASLLIGTILVGPGRG